MHYRRDVMSNDQWEEWMRELDEPPDDWDLFADHAARSVSEEDEWAMWEAAAR